MRVLALAMVLLFLPQMALAVENAQPGEDHHAEESTFLGLPRWSWKLLNMLLFFGFLGWLLAGPVKNILRQRREQIRQQLADARERDAKADRMAEEIRTRLHKLEGEIAAILRRAEEEGEKQRQELIAAANDEAEKILQSARSEVDARVKAARKELTDYAGELAAQRAHRLLEESLTEADRRKLFEESLDALPEEHS